MENHWMIQFESPLLLSIEFKDSLHIVKLHEIDLLIPIMSHNAPIMSLECKNLWLYLTHPTTMLQDEVLWPIYDGWISHLIIV